MEVWKYLKYSVEFSTLSVKESKTACGTGADKYEALYYKREVLYCKDPYRSAVVIFTVGLVTPSIEERKCCTEALVLRVLAAITSELQTTREIANAGAGVRGTPTLAVLLELLVLLKLNRLTDIDSQASGRLLKALARRICPGARHVDRDPRRALHRHRAGILLDGFNLQGRLLDRRHRPKPRLPPDRGIALVSHWGAGEERPLPYSSHPR